MPIATFPAEEEQDYQGIRESLKSGTYSYVPAPACSRVSSKNPLSPIGVMWLS